MITLHESQQLRARIIGAPDPVPLAEQPKPWLQPELTWVYDGQRVWVSCGRMWAAATVTCACGVHARVATRRWKTWLHVSALRSRS